MLYSNSGHSARRIIPSDSHASEGASDAVWFDLLRADDAERSLAERLTGLRVPAMADLAEVESSSRLSSSNGALYLSTPMTYVENGVSKVAPLGLVLSDKMLMTVRFAEMPVFDTFAERFQAGSGAASGAPCSVSAFLGLLEAVVDRLADVLEHVGGELDVVSRRVFRPDPSVSSTVDAQLRATLRNVGRAGERLSNIRDSLLGVQRIVSYVGETARDWIPEAMRPRLTVLRQDTASLSDYDTQLTNKVQFLLDATLGFINIEQANGIKILTVVSVVGVPPTLVASIYGMNFKWIPELQWEYGYFYGLAVIVASAVLPLLWFKKKGWI